MLRCRRGTAPPHRTRRGLLFLGTKAMLPITRRKNETLIFDDNIYVTVLDIRGDYVRLGIEAPPGTRIQKGESLAKVESSESASVETATPPASLAGRQPR
jgi:carbon storage regulator